MKNAVVKDNVQRVIKHIDAVVKMTDEELNAACARELAGATLTGPALDRKAFLIKCYVIDIFYTPIR